MRSLVVAVALVAVSLMGTGLAGHPQTAGSHTTVFDHKAGNEWWVEVRVTGSPSKVEARDDGGTWKPLTLRSWGAWAASFHIEPGHRVQFRASWSDGASVESCWFTHPAGVEQCSDGGGGGGGSDGGGGGTTGAYAFDHKTGNEWWIETLVSPKPVAVESMDEGGAWKTLTLRSWGAWAGSYHIEPGHTVKFRARGGDGVWHESCWFTHPAGVEQPCGGGGGGGNDTTTSWPREGSYVRYFLDAGESVPGYSQQEHVWLNYTHTGGAWRGTCEGWELTWTDHGGDEVERINTTVAPAPPLGGPSTAQPGEQRSIRKPSCGSAGTVTAFVDDRTEIPGYHGTETFKQKGVPVTVPVWTADYEVDDCPCQYGGVAWHWDTGLTIDYFVGYRYSHESGHLLDTDAPISKAETSVPPRPAWPVEGSFATYRVNLSDDNGNVYERKDVRFAFIGGAWQMTCTGESGSFAEAPPMGPPVTSVGKTVRPTEAHNCGITPPPVIVQGKFPQDTTRNGQFHRAEVWWADESPDTWGDEDAWWDTRTGLLLKWEDKGGYFQGDVGYLTNTDAPLSTR